MLQPKAKACNTRTGQVFIIMAMKSSTDSYAAATYHISPALKDFTTTTFKKTPPEVLRLAEGWAVNGPQGEYDDPMFYVAILI